MLSHISMTLNKTIREQNKTKPIIIQPLLIQ